MKKCSDESFFKPSLYNYRYIFRLLRYHQNLSSSLNMGIKTVNVSVVDPDPQGSETFSGSRSRTRGYGFGSRTGL
jgi:hypothetical protein